MTLLVPLLTSAHALRLIIVRADWDPYRDHERGQANGEVEASKVIGSP
jgi:hypothetical protein